MKWQFNDIKLNLRLLDPYHRGMIRQAINYRIGRRDFWSEPLPAICKKLLSSTVSPVIVDIGANIGTFSLPIAHEYSEATVFAVEAHPVPSAALFDNIRLNDLANVLQFSVAVSSTRDTLVKIYDCPTNSGGHRLAGFDGRSDLAGYDSRSISIPSITLLDFFSQNLIEKCDLLKIDTEGQEFDILTSLGASLHPPEDGYGVQSIIAEYGVEGMQAAGTSPQDLWHLMDEKGYGCVIVQSGREILAPTDIPVLPRFHVVDFLFTPK